MHILFTSFSILFTYLKEMTQNPATANRLHISECEQITSSVFQECCNRDNNRSVRA